MMLANDLYRVTEARHSEVEAIAAARQYLAALDLQYIVDAMCSDAYPLPRWTKPLAERCCQLYKNFLLLQRLYLDIPLVPTREIDEFWHNHILYTKEYTYDCQQIYGHYLHHAPANPQEDSQGLLVAFERTKALYFETFHQELTLIMD